MVKVIAKDAVPVRMAERPASVVYRTKKQMDGKPPGEQNIDTIAFLDRLMAENSDYDERVWPIVEASLNEP